MARDDKCVLIYVKTGIPEKFGFVQLGEAMSLANVIEYIRKHPADYYVVLPDILGIYGNYIKRLIPGFRNRDLIIVLGKPASPISNFLARLAYNPLATLIGNNLAIAVIISRRLVERVRDAADLSDLIKGAETIARIVYHEPIHDYIYMVYGRLPKPVLITLLEPGRMLKFAVVGLSGVLINLLFVYLSASLLVISDKILKLLLVGIIGFETSLTWNFMLHELWTFRDLKLKRSISAIFKRWIKYHVGSIGSLVAQTASITTLTGYLGLSLYKSTLIGIVLGFIVNYLVGRLYTWREGEG